MNFSSLYRVLRAARLRKSMQAKLSSFAFASSVQVEFISQEAANVITSRNRPISVSPDVLAVINAFCNEFIFLSTSACTTSDNDIPSTPTAALSVGATLAIPFTTECYKSRGLLRGQSALIVYKIGLADCFSDIKSYRTYWARTACKYRLSFIPSNSL